MSRPRVLIRLATAALACAPAVSAHGQPLTPAPGVTAEAGPADPRLPYRAATWGLVGGGVVLGVASGLVYAMGTSDEAVITDARRDGGVVTGITQIEAQRLQDSASRLQTFGAVGLGLAGGLLVGGLVTWLLEPDAPAPCGPAAPAEPAIRPFSLAPTFAPDRAGVALGWAF